jgi:hypothetical protein
MAWSTQRASFDSQSHGVLAKSHQIALLFTHQCIKAQHSTNKMTLTGDITLQIQGFYFKHNNI